MSLNNIFDIAGSAMTAQSIRLNTVASNLANAESASSSVDTTYRARKPIFAVIQQQALNGVADGMDEQAGKGVQVAGIVESQASQDMRFEPNHPMANEEGYVLYPNVNVVEEMADMISSSRSFQMNV